MKIYPVSYDYAQTIAGSNLTIPTQKLTSVQKLL